MTHAPLEAACPSEFDAAQAHHLAVRADAATGAPVTPQGRALLASSRPWAAMGVGVRIGECACGSSLCFAGDEEAE